MRNWYGVCEGACLLQTVQLDVAIQWSRQTEQRNSYELERREKVWGKQYDATKEVV